MSIAQALHQKALLRVKTLFHSESDVIDVLMEINRGRHFEELGYPSLFVYARLGLGLSESQSYSYCGIAKKSESVPELREKVLDGEITVSNARRIVSVVTPENKDTWLELASNLSQRELEKEIVKEKPSSLIGKDRVKPLNSELSELRLVLSGETLELLQRAKEVLSQKNKSNCDAEAVLAAALKAFLKKNDPVEKALRNAPEAKATLASGSPAPKTLCPDTKKRTPVPSSLRHLVNLRDQGQCTEVLPSGQRCCNRQFLDIHHVIPISRGGKHELQNLQTLCSQHHRLEHRTNDVPFRTPHPPISESPRTLQQAAGPQTYTRPS